MEQGTYFNTLDWCQELPLNIGGYESSIQLQVANVQIYHKYEYRYYSIMWIHTIYTDV